ncbi:MAG TPA: MFS transporter [Syntrophomonadaceae bacterium]|nr:MFS transporter [Syntrophomonadaceae bacterium]
MSSQLDVSNLAYAKRYKILAVVMLGGIMGPIDASIVNVILPTIASFFNVSIAIAQWVPMVYLLTISSLLLFYGRLGDIFGYKRIYLMGLACFIVASGFCGLAPSIYWLIVFRAIQGIGAGMMMSVPFAILTAVFKPNERGKALGINAISISAGLALGPTIGGLLTFFWSWRLVFLINIPIGIVGLLWGRKVIPDLKGQPGRIDIIGTITVFICLFSFLFFINQVQRSGINSITILSIVLALIAGFFFLYYEQYSTDPLVDLDIFKNSAFTLGIFSAFLNFASQYILVFLTPFYLQRIIHYSPGEIGLLMTCFPLMVMIVAPFSGALSDRLGTKSLAITGTSFCAVALIAMALLPVSASAFSIGWRLALFGLGTGIFQSPNNSGVMGSVSRPYLGVASSILGTMRNVGMILGIASAGFVLYSVVPPFIVVQDFLGGLEAIQFLDGLRYAYILGAVFSVFAAIFSFMQKGET